VRAYRLTDGLEHQNKPRVVLIRLSLVLVVLAVALLASGHASAVLPFVPRSLPVITLPK
jgi:hypothetical protein